jgi:glycosyltransferase involved in cell wall biosynthesis
MKPINVLVVSSKYLPEYAGSGLRAHTTYKRLSEKFPITFEVLTSSVTFNQNKVYYVDGKRVTRIAKKLFPLATDEKRKGTPASFIEKVKHGCNYLIEAALTWKFLIKNIKRFDTIHIFGKNWVTAATVTFAKIMEKPFIVELCNEVDTPYHYEPLLFRAIFGKKFPENTTIVCISDMLREMCERYGYKSNVWCRPNPVDDTRFFIADQDKMKLRKRHTSFGKGDILLSCILKFRPSKNQIFLLDVLKNLPEEFKLLLAGPIVESGPLYERDQDYLNKIKGKIGELHLESRVQLEARFVDKVDEYMKMSDVFLFPTTTEALGTPMLEAISCGIPVVANRIRGVTDCWIEDGKNGFISDLNVEEFAEKARKANDIDQAVLRQKREEILSHCSAQLIDERYFALIKETAKKG